MKNQNQNHPIQISQCIVVSVTVTEVTDELVSGSVKGHPS